MPQKRFKFSLAFYYISFVVSLLILIFLLYLSYKNYENQVKLINSYNKNFEKLNLQITILEKEVQFLFYDIDNYKQYLDNIHKIYNKIILNIKKIKTTNIHSPQIDALISNIEEDLKQFDGLLSKIKTDINEYYDPSNGIKINKDLLLKQLSNDTSYKKNNFDIYIKNIQKIEEKLYKNRSLTEFTDNYNALYKTILNRIKRYKINNIIAYSFLNQLSEYYNLINKAFKIKLNIGFTNQSLYYNFIKKTLNEAKTNIDQIHKEIINKNFDLNKNTWLIVLIALLIILTLLQAILMYRRIYLKWKDFEKILDEFAHGHMPEFQEITVTTELHKVSKTAKLFVEYLKRNLNIIEQLANYNFDIKIEKDNEKDRFAIILSKLKEKMLIKEQQTQEILKKEKIDKWMREGLTEIGAIMRKNTNNIDVFVKEVLKGIMQYTQSVQGAFFIYNEQEKYLELKYAYAYGRERQRNQKIALFEGLIGTAAAEKRFYFFDKVPENYIFIEDAFGQAKPEGLIIMPLVIENKLLGIIELSFIDPLDELKKEFFKRLSTEIAITLSYVKVNQKTQELLEQTKKQTQELQESEKQYKLNQEELKKIIKHLENQLNNKNKMINSLDQLIEEKIKQIEELKNKLFEKENQMEKLMNKFEKEKQNLKQQIKELTTEIKKLKNKQ